MENLITDIPLWWLLLWVIISFLISYWYYRPKGWLLEVKKFKRILMLSFRFTGLFLLGVLLLGILLQSSEYKKEKPLIITLIDNSSSMLNYSDSVEVKKKIPEFIKTLKNEYATNREFLFFSLDDLIQNIDSLNFDAKKSNLARLFRHIYDGYYGRNIGSIIFISDGNYNAGSNPINEAGNIKMTPIYTIAVGDTIQKRDQLITNAIHNDIAFLGNKFPIEVIVEGNLVNGLSTKISLKHNGKVIGEEKIQYEDKEYDVIKKTFLVEAKTIGFNEFTLDLKGIKDESNYENNTKTVYVEILDSRSKVLLIAGAPHPDVGAIKNVLVRDNNLDVTAKRANDLPKNLSVFDLIIWHEPGVGMLNEQIEKIESVKKPIWYIIGPNSGKQTINKLSLPIVPRISGQTDEIKPALNQSFNKFELTDNTRDIIRSFPPLTAHYGKLNVNQQIDVLFNQQVGTVVKDEPLLFFGQKGSNKYAITYGEGMWRWRLAEYQKNQNNSGFEELVGKIVQYLSVRSNTSKLRVQMPKNFNEDEAIKINASFYNESFEPITSVPIEFVLTDENGDQTHYDFVPRNINYLLSLGRLSSGLYSWEAAATYNNQAYTKSGNFAVQKIELEALDTKANHNLLYRIASNSEGEHFLLSQTDQIISAMNKREDIVPVSYETVSYKKLIDNKWWFFLVILLFSLEWLMRRYNGAY